MSFKKLHQILGPSVLIVCTTVVCHVRPDVAPSPYLDEIRERWGASEIVRDFDHIKEDAQKIMKLQELGEITTQEGLFYFLRMHDFDDNSKLDGLELLTAMTHVVDHGPRGVLPLEEKEAFVDDFFQYDDNKDGFVSYPEMRKHLAPDDSSDQ